MTCPYPAFPDPLGVANDDRGTATVEYTVILVLVVMGCVLAMLGLGVPLLSMFRTQQAWVLLPFP